MRDPNEIRRDLDQARGDLEHHVEELEHVIEGELEKPKHVIEEARHVVETAKKPFDWVDKHAVIATMGAFVLGVAIRMMQLALRPRQKSRWLLHD